MSEPGPAYRRAHVTELDSLPNELVEAEWKPVRGAFGIEKRHRLPLSSHHGRVHSFTRCSFVSTHRSANS